MMQVKELSKRLQYARILFAIAGLIISFYLASSVLFNTPVSCPGGQVINCDKVLGSLYSKTFGVSNTFFGIGYFVAVIALHFFKRPLTLALLSAASMGFVAYFVYAEYQIGSICLWCTGAHICALALFLISMHELR